MRLLLATNNKGKVVEMSEALADLPLDILKPQDLNITEKPEETGHTYAENALQKARFYHARSEGGPAILADDSGIIIEALANELGTHTRRWGAGPDVSDKEWIDFFLNRMRSEENKRARFQCCLVYIDPNGTEHLFTGECDGMITDDLEAEYLPGLPISACFKPDGFDTVFSALSVEEKNRVSHRGKALQLLRQHLMNLTSY